MRPVACRIMIMIFYCSWFQPTSVTLQTSPGTIRFRRTSYTLISRKGREIDHASPRCPTSKKTARPSRVSNYTREEKLTIFKRDCTTSTFLSPRPNE
ncbi:hypothetical protein F4782DRAFT_455280 [Xylaria castorea]|nr:hypothetical protein F4782DRAFT_455280 [Xylaria castorea]